MVFSCMCTEHNMRILMERKKYKEKPSLHCVECIFVANRALV